MKKKFITKLLSGFMAAAVTALPYIHAGALPATIYQEKTSNIITSGVRHEKITRLTEEGWLEINVIRADLSNSFLKVDTLVDEDSIQNLSYPTDLAKSANAVAAINGSFFM